MYEDMGVSSRRIYVSNNRYYTTSGRVTPISIHISISQPSGWQFETAEGARSVRQTMEVGKGEGGINERGFTEKSRRGRGEADDAGDVRAKEES